MVAESSFIWVSDEKPSSSYCAMLYFWWGCRSNLKFITLGSERVNIWTSNHPGCEGVYSLRSFRFRCLAGMIKQGLLPRVSQTFDQDCRSFMWLFVGRFYLHLNDDLLLSDVLDLEPSEFLLPLFQLFALKLFKQRLSESYCLGGRNGCYSVAHVSWIFWPITCGWTVALYKPCPWVVLLGTLFFLLSTVFSALDFWSASSFDANPRPATDQKIVLSILGIFFVLHMQTG